jgi:hypothetical protein
LLEVEPTEELSEDYEDMLLSESELESLLDEKYSEDCGLESPDMESIK